MRIEYTRMKKFRILADLPLAKFSIIASITNIMVGFEYRTGKRKLCFIQKNATFATGLLREAIVNRVYREAALKNTSTV